MSGVEFLSNNNISGHFGYGFRKETTRANYAVYVGPNYFTGVYAVPDSGNTFKPKFYTGLGGYVCAQAVKKFTYDIGGGIEVYLEANKTQIMGGLKFIIFFSNSYRGLKRNYNPNVKQK